MAALAAEGDAELEPALREAVTHQVLVPESGDSIQTLKAGLMEIADLFVVNKADRPGADRVRSDIVTVSEVAERSSASTSSRHRPAAA